MRQITIIFYLFSILLSGYSQVDSSHNQKEHIITPGDVVWQVGPPTLPPGAKYFLIEGHPLKAGPIIMRILLPAGYIIPAHFHPGAERATVISGTYNIGTGSKFSKADCKKMPGGSVAIIPAGGIAHFGWASEETIVQVHIDGPLQITYVDPKDDPRSKRNN